MATTWGITDMQFLYLYGALCLAGLVAAKATLARAIGPPPPDSDDRTLNLYETAMVGGGHQLAITAAATKLCHEGVLTPGSGPAGSLVAGCELGADAYALEREVYEGVRRTPQIATAELRRELDDSPAIDSLLTTLTDEGLVVDGPAYVAHRRLWIACALLAALGAARLVATGSADPYLAALVVAAAAGAFNIWRRHPIATRRGLALIAEQRDRQSWVRTTHRLEDSALAVALFGGASLWLVDPAIAAVLEVPREQARWSAGNDSCSSGGGGSGGWDLGEIDLSGWDLFSGGGGCGGCG